MKLDWPIRVVDAHAGGEPGRVVVGGVRDVPGASMLEKRDHLWRSGDRLRRLLLREPRGYPAVCANVIVPPTLPEADAGFVIMEQAEYPAMSGSNTICTATVLINERMVPVSEPVTELVLEAPAGLIRVRAEVRDGVARSITFVNVPAFAVRLDAPVEVPGIGTVRVDVAWGGMFYALTEAAALGFRITPDEARDLVRVGEMVKAAAREQVPVSHPERPELAGITIMEWTAPASAPGAHGRNTVVVSSGQLDWSRPESFTGVLDRSPCGTGTCARMAVLHARGQLGIGQDYVHEGILGTTWTGRLLSETRVGPYPGVVPQLTGSAWITGRFDLTVDPEDPFPEGFTVGDIWGCMPDD
ncbi:MAG TPA: proline racemase family protein [candidate division Zixibacteria bacterium]|nr:proline racemase family protein [candidate division Zixibacteria bacterium]